MYYTYILLNEISARYYIGYTPDLRNRIRQHIHGQVQSTKSNRNYHVAWYCAFPTLKQAVSFEKYLKSGSGVAFMKKRFLKSGFGVLAKYTGRETCSSKLSEA